MTQWIVNIKAILIKIKSTLDLKMMIPLCRNNIICIIRIIKEGHKISMKRIMGKKTLMRAVRMSKMKMMNMERKKTRIWMNMGKRTWIIIKIIIIKWCMEMKMTKMIYLNQKKCIINLMIWRRGEKMNRHILWICKRKPLLHLKKKINKFCKYLQTKNCKTNLMKIKTHLNQLICKKNILNLFNSNLNRKTKK